jgi:hypothetical protein
MAVWGPLEVFRFSMLFIPVVILEDEVKRVPKQALFIMSHRINIDMAMENSIHEM